uniref:cytochrome P450 71A1-like n=1 Tax=Erigeron canadensis TaxID=72917 RepID=UPI001CB91315|nr:cytochrome P450 71A1-like [Erigeron canadensis]
MPFHYLLLLLLLLPILSFFYLLLPKIIKNKSKFNNPPGPPRLPIIGNLHQIDTSSLHTSLWNLSKSYGPIVSLDFGFIPTIVVSSATLAKEVMKTHDLIFCSRPLTLAQKKFTYNGLDVVFSPYNEYWREMRKISIMNLFSPKRMQSSKYIREEEVSLAINNINKLSSSSKVVNLSEIAKSVTCNIVMRMGFGKKYDDENERRRIVGLIGELQVMIAHLFLTDLWPGLPFVGLVDKLITGNIDRLDKCFNDLDSFYQELIDERLDPRNQKSHEEQRYIIDILIQLKKDQVLSPIELTNDHIKAMLTDVLVAGTDASAAIVVWAMTSLIKNPKVMKKAQEEVRNVVGKKTTIIDEDDLPKFTYLKAIVKEVMRLYPPAPLLVPREAKKDIILNNGYKIKQNTMVHVNAFAIGRDPKSWENPEEFLPERFLGHGDIDFRGNDFEFIPFGAGRRICPGISMGVMLVELLLANLVYFFDWGLPLGMKIEDINYEVMPGITMHKKNELCLLAH